MASKGGKRDGNDTLRRRARGGLKGGGVVEEASAVRCRVRLLIDITENPKNESMPGL